jgi:hypothetical protein
MLWYGHHLAEPKITMTTDDLLLSPAERDVVRREFMYRFGGALSINEGFHLKRWGSGSKKGEPKLTAATQGLLDRGLIRIVDEGYWPVAFFTDKGVRALKRMAMDRRSLDPERHRLLIQELADISDAE